MAVEKPFFGCIDVGEVSDLGPADGAGFDLDPERIADQAVVGVYEGDRPAVAHPDKIIYGSQRVAGRRGWDVALDKETLTVDGGTFVGHLGEPVQCHSTADPRRAEADIEIAPTLFERQLVRLDANCFHGKRFGRRVAEESRKLGISAAGKTTVRGIL